VTAEAPTIDRYAPLSHKAGLRAGTAAGAFLAPMWVPKEHHRRLAAYRILAGYLSNTAREFLVSEGMTPAKRLSHREFGDPHLLVTRVAHGVLGDDPQVAVGGAVVEAVPSLPEAPDDLPPDASPLEARVHALATARWEAEAEAAVSAWEAALASQPEAAAREQALTAWATSDDVQLAAKLALSEGKACGLGDAAVALFPQGEGLWPRVEVFEGGFYFPVRDEATDRVHRVHVAWEYERTTPRGTERFVRRLTWDLVDVVTGAEEGDPAAAGISYPWRQDGAPASSVVCLYSDGTWPLNDLKARGVNDLEPGSAVWAVRDLPIGCDEIPVGHVQGVDVGEDFGASVITVVAQALDELAALDTDIADAAALAAAPMVSMAGGDAGSKLAIQPGTVWGLAADGRMDVLDLTAGLSELRAVRDSVRDRVGENAQVPGEAVGRVRDGEGAAASGYHFSLKLDPFRQFIEALRVSRRPVWTGVLRSAQKLAMTSGALEAGPILTARVVPGPYLPSDLAGAIEQVTKLLTAKAISTEAAVQLLVAAGLTIEDAGGEVARIRADDTAGALDVANATGSEQAAADWLGIPIPEVAGTPAAPVVPPTPPEPAP